ncbi:hypothetical protein C1645_840534 [Glomus cerebriforme]|uniref:Uncharacterized protein n=1 Tax=Glomus cerebriforme TaxID=658196 RepID=A0A397RZ44_9GLOM|nr:hypothetical protein C1645_840534 [Glomus cerebriforme]
MVSFATFVILGSGNELVRGRYNGISSLGNEMDSGNEMASDSDKEILGSGNELGSGRYNGISSSDNELDFEFR